MQMNIGPLEVASFFCRDNLAHGYGTYVHQNGTIYQGPKLSGWFCSQKTRF